MSTGKEVEQDNNEYVFFWGSVLRSVVADIVAHMWNKVNVCPKFSEADKT